MSPLPEEKSVEEVQVSPAGDTLQPDDIVISGMSGTYANCQNMQELFEKLYAKVDVTVNDKSRWSYQHPEAPKYVGMAPNLGTFDAQFFKVHRKFGQGMDAMSRKLLEHAYQSIYDAGITPVELRDKNVGVFVGAGLSDREKVSFYVPSTMNALGIAGCSRSMYANRISYWLDAKGPSICIDAACSSSLVALDRAYDYMRRGICDAAIVGGSNLCFHPHVSVHLKRMGVLCDDGKTRSFDKNASGAVRADAVNCIFLQKAANARRVYAKIIHIKSQYNVDKDAMNKEQKYGPNRPRKCLVEFWNDFYRQADVSPHRVEYVEAYGSAVPEADLEELDAIGEVFCKGKESSLSVGSVVSNIGHTGAASGISAVTKVLLAYHSRRIAANLHYETPHDQVRAIQEGRIQVVVENQPFAGTYAAVNNYSFGGLNYHVLLHGLNKDKNLEKYNTNIPRLVTLSGRTESSVNKIIHELKLRAIDAEEIGLLHNIHKQDIQGHLARGYTVLTTNEESQTVSVAENCDYYSGIKRPVWFVYSGMGSQWAGMGAQLIRIPIFANAIEKCHKALEPKGVDLIKILIDPDKAIYDNILNSFVGIAAVQIGLTDILHELDVVPDNIIGHSVGELGCAYADGCLTAEEMILSAYSRGLVSIETPFIRGAMAAVGLGYKEIIEICPTEIEVACHNSSESSTISGPEDVMRAFVKELIAKGIFAKEVPCSNIAYHSRYIAEAGPGLLKYLKEVIKSPKPRSPKWLSTSVPQNKWDEPEAKYSSAEYHTNNLLGPVLFEETSCLIPSNAVVIEIAPHGLLQAILKRSLGQNCIHIPLTRRGNSDPVTFLLDSIGKLYQAGLTPNIQVLYPKIDYPVSTGTPMLSHLVEWMHSEYWVLPKYAEPRFSKSGRRTVVLSVHDDEYKYTTGNVKDGAMMFSEAGILVLVWETLAMLLGKKMNQVSVKFSDVRFESDVVATYDEVLVLDVTVQKGSGQFEVTHMNNIVASGCIQELGKVRLRAVVVEPVKGEHLTSSEIYELFHIRGYSYSGSFRSIYKSNVSFTKAQIIWNRNWVTFIDSIFQLNVLKRNYNGISKIKLIRRIIIKIEEHHSANIMKVDKEGHVLDAQILNFGVETRCGGFSLKDVTFNDISQTQSPTVIKKREFIPYHPAESIDINTVIHTFLQIVAENCPDGRVNAIEFIQSKDEKPLGFLIKKVANELTDVSFDHKCISVENVSDIETIKGRNLFIGHNLFSEGQMQKFLTKTMNEQKFIMSVENNEALLANSPYVEVAAMKAPTGLLVLAKLPIKKGVNEDVSIISAIEDLSDSSFLEHTINNLLPTQRLILTADMPPPSGLKALICKLRTTPEQHKVNLIITDTRADSDCNVHEQLSKDLAIMMYRKGCWGSEYYLPSNEDTTISRPIRMHVTVPGDLESLCWMEIPDDASSKSVQVHYSGLTQYDVLKATAARPGTTEKDTYGMDFSGIDSRGERVMGVVASGALASAVAPDEELLWPVPAHWTLEDAATVPQPYTHAYYCLMIKSNLQKGSRLLVHCGAGTLSQAIISIALSMDCEVFTTVSSMNKKRFLKSLFPELQDNHIGSSRDTSFVSMVMEQTNGERCNTVISCLGEELRKASMQCVTMVGTFINVSTSNCYENTCFTLSFLKEGKSYSQTVYSLILEKDVETKRMLHRMVSEGIAAGHVRPLSRLVLGGRDVPRALRLLASGNHCGRALVSPDDVPAQLKVSLSNSSVYAVVCRDHVIGLELVDRLIGRGARNVMIHHSGKDEWGYLKIKLCAWKNTDANIKTSNQNLQTYNGAVEYLKKSAKLGLIEGIFVVDCSEVFEKDTSITEYLDKAAKKMCPSLKYFVVLRPMADTAEPQSQRICARRRLENIPALYLNLPTLAKFGQQGEIAQGVSSALDALETSLRLDHQEASVLALKEKTKCDLLDKIGKILEVNLRNVPLDTTLESLGLYFERAEEVKNLLEWRYKFPCSRRNLPDLTVGRLQEVEISLNDFAKKKPTKLGVYFQRVDPDELTSSAELLVMQTLVYEPQIRNDKFEANETYLILIPGMEGHHGVFSRLCKRLKIFALCMQYGVDNPSETPHQTAQRFVKKILQMVKFKGQFYLLGYSYGVLVAMEMAAILEQKGLQGTIFCVDTAPDVFSVQLKATLGEKSENELQNAVIDHMYTVMAGRSSQELRQRLVDIASWVEKVDLAWRRLRGLVQYSSQYARTRMETAYGRIVEAKRYSPERLQGLPLRSKVVLMKSRRQPEELTAYSRDFGLSKYTRQPVEVYDLEAEHADVMQDLRCTTIVHKHLDPCLLEEYFQKNLCETYLPEGMKIIDID